MTLFENDTAKLKRQQNLFSKHLVTLVEGLSDMLLILRYFAQFHLANRRIANVIAIKATIG